MGLGGPVWHCSVAPLRKVPTKVLERIALKELEGVGAPISGGEWREFTGRAFHIRRRLAPDEEALVGPVVDIRNTEEAKIRWERTKLVLPVGVLLAVESQFGGTIQ